MMNEMNPHTPSDEFVRQIDVHTLLPQQDPFVMIGQMQHFDMSNVKTSTEILLSNIFVEDETLDASGIIENIAQTCAARIGYINQYILKKGIQIGFIGAIKNFFVYSLPKVGERIETSVTINEEVFGMLLATAQVSTPDRLIASSEIKIAIKE